MIVFDFYKVLVEDFWKLTCLFFLFIQQLIDQKEFELLIVSNECEMSIRVTRGFKKQLEVGAPQQLVHETIQS